jgi:hypothetical protein
MRESLGAIDLGRQAADLTIQFIHLLFMCLSLFAGIAVSIEQFRQSLEGNLLPFFQLARALRAPDIQFCRQLVDGLFFFQQFFDRFGLEDRTILFAHGLLGLYFCPFYCPNSWVH